MAVTAGNYILLAVSANDGFFYDFSLAQIDGSMQYIHKFEEFAQENEIQAIDFQVRTLAYGSYCVYLPNSQTIVNHRLEFASATYLYAAPT